MMIGDASGKEGQFSDSDRRKQAENFGCEYMEMLWMILCINIITDNENKGQDDNRLSFSYYVNPFLDYIKIQ